jgi:hypothetical protein
MAPARIDAIDGVRLDFRLSPFCRIAWVSEAARSLWEPRLNRVRAASEVSPYWRRETRTRAASSPSDRHRWIV